jgi:hypothetical protein
MRHTNLILFIGVAAAGISVSPASATVRIISDPGGPVIDYVVRFEAARVSGEPIIIDGACLSACTLAIALLPRGQVCARLIPPMCASGSPATAACPSGLSYSRAASLLLWYRPATLDPLPAPTPLCVPSGRDYFRRAIRQCGNAKAARGPPPSAPTGSASAGHACSSSSTLNRLASLPKRDYDRGHCEAHRVGRNAHSKDPHDPARARRRRRRPCRARGSRMRP